ncbi:MAG: asparagine synthase-related protein, partial [Candidatus Thorarchaeota archaeon]
RPIEPNEILKISWDGTINSKQQATEPLEPWKGSQDDALKRLEEFLRTSVELTNDWKSGVLFSGGVDSSLVAQAVKDTESDILLFSAGTETSRDNKQTTYAAKKLKLERVYTEMTPEIVWDLLPEVIFAAEVRNRMDVEIALPFYVCSKKAKEHGVNLLFSGQGPDELFAGYTKHVRLYQEEGSTSLENQLRKEISITHEANISRDERVIATNGITAYFPYLETHFVRTALSLPAEWKIDPGKSPERKVIFRKLARRMGLPKDLALAPKKATQFSSGSSKMLTAAIVSQSGVKDTLTSKQADDIAQDILNQISFKLGFPMIGRKIKKMNIDLEPTFSFAKKRGINLQQ